MTSSKITCEWSDIKRNQCRRVEYGAISSLGELGGSRAMRVQIESPEGVAALTEFVQFYDQVYEYRDARWPAYDQVYEYRDARWPAAVAFQVPVLTGESPFAQERKMRPFLARAGGRLLARTVAVVDERYNQ